MIYTFTINTDASFDSKNKIGAWACWIKSSHYRIKESALFSGPVSNSSLAELMAIEQALRLVDTLISDQPYLQDHEVKLHINTDSMFAIHGLTGKIKQSKHREYIYYVQDMLERFTGGFTIKHVKAHRRIKDSRTYVNNWCDEASRSHVRRRVKEINGQHRTAESI